MDETAVDVYKKAKEGLEKGDEELVNRVGQGKDIMSILCTYTHFQYIIFVMTKVMSNRYSKSKQRKEGRRKVI